MQHIGVVILKRSPTTSYLQLHDLATYYLTTIYLLLLTNYLLTTKTNF